jgi:hypothetical protein
MDFILSSPHARFYSILGVWFIELLNTTQPDDGLCQKSKHIAEVLVNMLIVLDC